MRVHCLINNVMQPFHHAYALCDCLFAVHLHADFLGISLSLQPSSSLDSASLFPMSPHFLSLSLFNEMTWWTQCSSSTWRQPLCCQLLRSRQLSVCLSRLYLCLCIQPANETRRSKAGDYHQRLCGIWWPPQTIEMTASSIVAIIDTYNTKSVYAVAFQRLPQRLNINNVFWCSNGDFTCLFFF